MSHLEISIYNNQDFTDIFMKFLIYHFDDDFFYLHIFRTITTGSNSPIIDMGVVSFDSLNALVDFIVMSVEENGILHHTAFSIYNNKHSIYKRQITTVLLLQYDIKEMFEIFSHINTNKRKKDLQRFLLQNYRSSIFPPEILHIISSFI